MPLRHRFYGYVLEIKMKGYGSIESDLGSDARNKQDAREFAQQEMKNPNNEWVKLYYDDGSGHADKQRGVIEEFH